jgi:methyl-accepting chemotaxis protein
VIFYRRGADQYEEALKVYLIFIAGYAIYYVAAVLFINKSMNSIVRHIREMAMVAYGISRGEKGMKLTSDYNNDDELGTLKRYFGTLAEEIENKAHIMEEMSEGRYGDVNESARASGLMSNALITLAEKNKAFNQSIREASERISSGSQQIASSAQSLASGSNEQAATIQQFSATIAEVNEMAVKNAAIAEETLTNVRENIRIREKNIEDMHRMKEAMDTITGSSQKIQGVIKVIDDIAFQTNILALNAAVEAARAGQHGKGFAVVADEVRDLASKSAEAARETSRLIQDSLTHVAEGNKIVDMTNQSIVVIEGISRQSETNMDKLAEASKQQSASISQLSAGIDQISNVVQANSAMAEESAAAAGTMSAQADQLEKLIAQYGGEE